MKKKRQFSSILAVIKGHFCENLALEMGSQLKNIAVAPPIENFSIGLSKITFFLLLFFLNAKNDIDLYDIECNYQ